jgi:hypothetical protein
LPRSTPSRSRLSFVLIAALVSSLLLSACGLLGDEEDGAPADGGPVADGIEVLDSAMSTQVDANKQASGVVANAFPPNVPQVFIVLVLRGVEVGAEITGRWYQLMNDGPPEGTELSVGSVVLTQENVVDGVARVELNLSAGAEGFPVDDYLVRVYAGDEIIKTTGFVVSSFVVHPQGQGAAAPTPAPQPEPSPTPGSAAPQPTATAGQQPPTPTATQPVAPTATQSPSSTGGTPETYTVVSGDTLTIIADRFKPATESTESYVARLREANGLEPGAILFVDQVLTLPGPQ